MNIQEELQDLFEDNGHYTNVSPVPVEIISEYSPRLPDFLIKLWERRGFGSWGDGFYNVCNPHDFDGLLSQIFHADADFSHSDCYVYAYSSFGELFVWSERYGVVKINLTASLVSCEKALYPEKGGDSDMTILLGLVVRPDSLNVYDETDKPLFARAKKKLGVLEPGECYGFAPALAMGGAPNLQNLSKMKAYEHFLFLAQLQNFTLMDYLSRPIRAVRQIG